MGRAYDTWKAMTGPERLAAWDLAKGRGITLDDVALYRQAHPSLSISEAMEALRAQSPQSEEDDGNTTIDAR